MVINLKLKAQVIPRELRTREGGKEGVGESIGHDLPYVQHPFICTLKLLFLSSKCDRGCPLNDFYSIIFN